MIIVILLNDIRPPGLKRLSIFLHLL